MPLLDESCKAVLKYTAASLPCVVVTVAWIRMEPSCARVMRDEVSIEPLPWLLLTCTDL